MNSGLAKRTNLPRVETHHILPLRGIGRLLVELERIAC